MTATRPLARGTLEASGPPDLVALPPPGGAAHNLPTPLCSLVGREHDLREVRATVSTARLVTLTGAGGVGKTRLAVEAAARCVSDFPAGVWWVELAALADPGMVESTLVQALGVRPVPGLGELDAAVGFLCERHALLVLDNCEHVIEEVARVADVLLRRCPSLSILATSRVPLAIPGETRWVVPPLSVPTCDAPDGVRDSEAARLFVDRAGRVDRSQQLNDGNARAIAEICRQLEGMPLALELAAARVAVLSPPAIARGLEDSLGLLTARSFALEERHRSLRASLDWSYGLLCTDARILLRRLAVFAGGTTLELAKEVCGWEGLAPSEILTALETLVEHSLVQVDAHGETVRYRLLETVRQYALERLEEAGERPPIRGRHLDALLALAERQRREALTPRQPEVFAALDPEAANLGAALDHGLATHPDKALRLCLALDFWYRARARFREADDAYGRAVAASDPSPVLRACALAAWAWIVGNSGDFGRANELAAEAAACASATGDEGAIAITQLVLANHRFFTDPIGALETLRRCRDLGRAVDDEYILTRSEALIRGVAWFQQDEQACTAGFDELRPRLERLGDRETLAWFWFEQGAVRYPLGEHEEAAELLARAVAAAAEIGEPTADRAARTYLALIDADAGQPERALEQMRAIHAQTLLHGGSFALPWIEVLLAQAEAGSGRLEAAGARLRTLVEIEAWGAAHALAWAQTELAEALRLLGEDGAAARHSARALERAHELGNKWLAAKAQLTLGRVAASRLEWTEAEQLVHVALTTIWDCRYNLELPSTLEALAQVSEGLDSHVEAARILGAAARLRDELGFVAWTAQRAEVAEVRGRVADALGRPAFRRALSEGAAMTNEGMVAWLRRGRGERKRPASGWGSLTPTEVEVVRQAAAGLTNPQIGERLFIARATVKAHLSHVYAKLGVRNRSQLAAEAAGRIPLTES
jgi:predicted ATPase/DNA-binding CsgD family transcriptional regulator